MNIFTCVKRWWWCFLEVFTLYFCISLDLKNSYLIRVLKQWVPYLTHHLECLSTSDGSHSLQLCFSWHNCPSPFYSIVSKLFPDVEIFEVLCDKITPTKLRTASGENLRYHVICIHSLEVAKVSKPAPSISSGILIILNFSWSSWVLIHCSRRTPQIQQTIPLSADIKRRIVSLDVGHVSQPYGKLFLIQEVKKLPQFLSKIQRFVMIGNRCLMAFHATVMHMLVASTQPPNSPSTSPRYWKVDTASNVSSPTCTWVEFKLSVGTISPLHFLHLNMRSFFTVPYNSRASFMNPEAATLAKYWVDTNTFGTSTTKPFNISWWLLSLTRRTKYLSLALIYS